MGNYQQAQTYFELSKAIAERIDYPLGLAIALANIGYNLGKLDQTELAIAHLTEAFDRLKQVQTVDLAATAAYKPAEIYHQIDRDELALIYLEFALDTAREFSLPLAINCEKLVLTISTKKIVD